MASRSRSDAALAAVLACFALNSLVTRYIVSRGLLDPGLATALRFLAGTAMLAALGWSRPRRDSIVPALALGAYAVLISYGYARIGAAAGTLVFYACVLATLLACGALLEGHKPGPRALAGGALALAGLGLLAARRPGGATLAGVLMLAGTGVAWGYYSWLGRGKPDPQGATTRAFVALAPAMLVLGVGASLAGGAWSWRGALLALGMGALTTALAYVAWYKLQARLTPAQAGTYQMAVPLLTAALGILVLQEPFSWDLVAAAGLVVGGMALAR